MENTIDTVKVNAIKAHLAAAGQTISVGESVTAGLLQQALASADFASDYFQGGITTYNLGQKSRHLMVDPIHAISCNCVSEQIAKDMASNACKLFSSDWGIGITGYSSPVPESNNELYCFFAVTFKDKLILQNKITAAGSAKEVQTSYVAQVIDAFHGYLSKQ